MHKIGQSGGFLGRLLGPFPNNGLPLMKNVLKTLAKSFLIPLGLPAQVSATDAAIHEKIFGLDMTKLVISNEEMNNIMRIVKSLEWSVLLIKGVSEALKNEAREKTGRFFGTLLETFGTSLSGNLSTGKVRQPINR